MRKDIPVNPVFVTKLNLNFTQRPTNFLEFMNLSNEEIAVPLSNLSIRDVNHVSINIEIHLQIRK